MQKYIVKEYIRNLEKNKIIKINRSIKKTSILELPKNTSEGLKLGMKIDFIL